MNSILRFWFKVLLASNLVIRIWEAQEKITVKEKIFVNIRIFSEYAGPNQNFKIKGYNGINKKIIIELLLQNIKKNQIHSYLFF